MKRKQVMYSLIALAVLLGVWGSQSIKLKATEGLENPETFANAPAEWVGDVNQVGKLKYGYVKARAGSSTPAIGNTSVANVQFDKGGGEMISHIFMSKSQGTVAGSGFNLYETSEEYQTVTTGGPSGEPVGIVDFEVPTLTGTSIKVNGSRQGSTEYQVEAELMPIQKNAQILHNFTITNTSSGAKTFYPIHYVDTELANNDKVPIKSRGEGQGLYIETVEYEGKEPIEGSPTYRLDYITDVPNGPISYKGISHGTAPEKAFGTDMDKPDTSHVNVPEGEIVPGPAISDSGIILAWGKQVLAAGESATFSYAVGMEAGSIDVVKEVTNQTSQDGNYRVNDVLEYNISLTNEDLKVFYDDLLIEDQLPIGLAAPSKIALVKADGSEEELNISDVYDEASHKITVKKVPLAVGQEGTPTVVSLKYTTTITEEGADSEVTNTVHVSGESNTGSGVAEEAEQVINVLPTGKLILNYQDADKKDLLPQKIIFGTVGDDYKEEPAIIAGYTDQSVEGNPAGKFTKEDQIVTFIYDTKNIYDLVQTVTNSGGANLDGGEAAVSEVLTYAVTLTPKTGDLTEEELKAKYRDVLITEAIDPALEDIKEISLKTKAGVDVGEAKYDPEKQAIVAMIKESQELSLTEELILTYQGKVKGDTAIDTIIKEKATAVVSYTFSETNVHEVTSNEVTTTISKASKVHVRYVNEDGDDIHEPKSHDVEGDYDESALEIDGFTYDHTEGEASGTLPPGESVSITFHYKSVQFELEQKVTQLDGSSAEVVKNGTALIYSVTLTSKLTEESLLYNQFELITVIDPSLENIKDVKLMNSQGETVGSAEASNGKVKGTLTKENKVKGTEDLKLTYQATVKDKLAAPAETLITAETTAGGTYFGQQEIPARLQTSNKVSSTVSGGELIFKSAPEALDFGSSLKMPSKETYYPIELKTGDLSVIDSRGTDNKWSMTAKMATAMTQGDHVLEEAMYYMIAGKPALMSTTTSAKVYDQVTESDADVIISATWNGVQEGPVLKLGRNEVKKGEYAGSIQWTLADGPLNE